MSEDARQLVADACQVLNAAGLTELFTGHVSCRVKDDRVLIPAHRHDEAKGLESITVEHVIEIDLEGTPTGADAPEPPEESVIHTEIMRGRDDVTSVAHAHPEYATGVSAAQRTLEPATLNGSLLNGPVPVHDAGLKLLHTDADGRELAETLGDHDAALIRGHGAVTVGASVAEATARMWMLERTAKLHAIGAQVGGVTPFEGATSSEFMQSDHAGHLTEMYDYLRRIHLGLEQ